MRLIKYILSFALLLLTWSVDAANPVEKQSFLYGFAITDNGHSVYSELQIEWTGGYAMVLDRDYQLPFKVCPTLFEFNCLAISGSALIFSVPKNQEALQSDWFFFGRRFHLVSSYEGLDERMLIIESSTTAIYQNSLEEERNFGKTVFWFSSKRGLLGYQYLSNPKSGMTGVLTRVSQEGGITLSELEKLAPRDIILGSGELKAAFSPTATVGVELILRE